MPACSTTVAGTPTWPGARLERVTLTAADFPPGVQYDRLVEDPAQPDGAGGPPGMLSKPPDCTNALTNVIAKSAERGPGSAAKYSVGYDGVRIVMTVLSWHLDLDQLAAAADALRTLHDLFRSVVGRDTDDHHQTPLVRRRTGLPADHAAGRPGEQHVHVVRQCGTDGGVRPRTAFCEFHHPGQRVTAANLFGHRKQAGRPDAGRPDRPKTARRQARSL